MRKIYSFLLMVMLLPALALAQSSNMAISKTCTSSYYSSKTEKRLLVPFSAIAMPQDAVTATDPGHDFSIGMWFKTTGVNTASPGVGVIFRMGTGDHMNTNGAAQLYTTSAGALTFTFAADNIGGSATISAGTAALNEWHYALLVFDSTNGNFRVYLDGTETANDTSVTKFGYKWADGVFQFICQNLSAAFDELQLYSKALTADEAAVAYLNARAVDGLASLFTFDSVKAGTTGQFESVAGSVSDAIATFQNCTYTNYWAEGLAYLTTQAETDPSLIEGREIAATEANVNISYGEGGQLTVSDGENTYAEGDNTIMTGTDLTITAVPSNGYNLVGIYAVDPSDTEKANRTEIADGATYTVVADVNIFAEWSSAVYTLTVANENSVPYTIKRGAEEVTDLTQLVGGAEYTLTLNVPYSMILNGVSLGDQTLTAASGVYTFTLDSDATLTIDARDKAQYNVTVQQAEGGTVSVAYFDGTADATTTTDATVYEGTELTLSNTKNEGYTFVNYLVNGSATVSETYTVVDADVTISAVFEEGIDYCEPEGLGLYGSQTRRSDRSVTTLVLSDGTSSTTVSGLGSTTPRNIYVDRTDIIFQTNPGSTVTVNIAGSGVWMNTYAYIDWDLNGLDDSDKVYSNNTGGSNNVATSFTFTVPSDQAGGNYRFRYKLDWDDQGPCYVGQAGNDNGDCAIDLIINIPAQTLDAPRTITVASENDDYGTVAITNPATEGNTVSTDLKVVTVEATPADGLLFINWTNDADEVVSTDAVYNYTGETDITLTAHFGYSINWTVGTGGSVAVTVNGVHVSTGNAFAPNSEVVFTVTAPAGKESQFVINGNTVELVDNAYTTTLTENLEVAVTFVDRINRYYETVTGKGRVECWTSFDENDPDVPAGTQLSNGSQLPSTYAEDGSANALNFWFYPETGEELVSVFYQMGTEAAVEIPYGAEGEGYFDPVSETLVNQGVKVWYTMDELVNDVTLTVTFSDSVQGIEEIGIDPANGPVEYYNLQGVRVAAENLAPGFYIVRQGSVAKKVFIQK